jgi:hypothetical protein
MSVPRSRAPLKGLSMGDEKKPCLLHRILMAGYHPISRHTKPDDSSPCRGIPSVASWGEKDLQSVLYAIIIQYQADVNTQDDIPGETRLISLATMCMGSNDTSTMVMLFLMILPGYPKLLDTVLLSMRGTPPPTSRSADHDENESMLYRFCAGVNVMIDMYTSLPIYRTTMGPVGFVAAVRDWWYCLLQPVETVSALEGAEPDHISRPIRTRGGKQDKIPPTH